MQWHKLLSGISLCAKRKKSSGTNALGLTSCLVATPTPNVFTPEFQLNEPLIALFPSLIMQARRTQPQVISNQLSLIFFQPYFSLQIPQTRSLSCNMFSKSYSTYESSPFYGSFLCRRCEISYVSNAPQEGPGFGWPQPLFLPKFLRHCWQ